MKNRYLSLVLGIALIGSGILIIQSPRNRQKSMPAEKLVESVATAFPRITKLEYFCEKGKTAFELLSQKNQIKSNESSFGKIVTEINGVTHGGGKYWLYSIDGKEASVSASAYVCQKSEMVSWELK